MPTDTSVATKTCCACGADVTGQARMKDSQSRYWCMPCGEADQRRKQLTSTHSLCAGCKQSFPKGKLDKQGDYFFCKGCLKKRSRVTSTSSSGHATVAGAPGITTRTTTTVMRSSAAGANSSGETSDRKRVVLMAAVLLVLILASVLFNFIFAA